MSSSNCSVFLTETERLFIRKSKSWNKMPNHRDQNVSIKDGPLLRVKAKDIRAIYSDPNANNEIDLLFVGHFRDAYEEANLVLLKRIIKDV